MSRAAPDGAPVPEAAWRSTALGVAALIAGTVAVLVVRRPGQFTHPYVWIEDGTIILPAYLARGFASLFEPVSGYLILSSKLIALSAFALSAEYAPEIMLALTVAFTCAVVLAIAFAPTHLRLPYLCAITPLIIPTNPEVFAVSELSFWWAGLLCVLALLWDADRGRLWLRAGFIVFGGLSSPIVVPVAGLLVLRALVERRRSEVVAAAIGVAVALIQYRTYRGTAYPVDFGNLFDPRLPLWASNKFVAYFFAGNRYGQYYLGPVFLALIGYAAWRIRDRLSLPFVLLVAVWGAICATTLMRIPIGAIDPINGGPRYFFYPYVLLSWTLIWIAALSPPPVRALIAAGFMMGIAWVYKGMTRSHEAVDWRQHLARCAQSETYALPIHFDGRRDSMWELKLTGAECRDFVTRSLFRRP